MSVTCLTFTLLTFICLTVKCLNNYLSNIYMSVTCLTVTFLITSKSIDQSYSDGKLLRWSRNFLPFMASEHSSPCSQKPPSTPICTIRHIYFPASAYRCNKPIYIYPYMFPCYLHRLEDVVAISVLKLSRHLVRKCY
jgi:hypothetical protein